MLTSLPRPNPPCAQELMQGELARTGRMGEAAAASAEALAL